MTEPKAKGYPHKQTFNIGAKPGKKKNSWWNPQRKIKPQRGGND